MKRILGLVILGLVGLSVYFWRQGEISQKQPEAGVSLNPVSERKLMQVGETKIQVEKRDTPAGRELGLSYRQGMAEDEGMLFIFDQAYPYAFWMKGMEFPLDIIWISNGVVVEISQNLLPPNNNGSPPQTAQPGVRVDQVLEVNGGFAARHGIRVGDTAMMLE